MGKIKITDKQVEEIREIVSKHERSYRDIGNQFETDASVIWNIAHHKTRRISRVDLFWSHVKKSSPYDCWEWQGAKMPGGYGSAFRHSLAHRVSFELTFGAIPIGMNVLHRCDNPPCCNPSHLFLGTNMDNTKDMIQKGRFNCGRGSKQGSSKLTESKVVQIRQLRKDGISCRDLATRFGVKIRNIFHVINRETWKHV